MRKPTAKSSLFVRGRSAKTAKRMTNFAGNLGSARARASTVAQRYALSQHASPTVPRPVPAQTSPRQITFDSLADMSQQARERAVMAGLPPTLLDQAAAKLGLSQRAFLAALKIAPTTVARNKAAGNALSVDDSDRVARLAQLWHDTMMVFEHEEGTRAWLTGRVPVLDAVPLELVHTSQGFARAHTAILQLAYGVYA
jgi:putative toxin-antitoxin system antitoxin component (TIGR02293 family)